MPPNPSKSSRSSSRPAAPKSSPGDAAGKKSSKATPAKAAKAAPAKAAPAKSAAAKTSAAKTSAAKTSAAKTSAAAAKATKTPRGYQAAGQGLEPNRPGLATVAGRAIGKKSFMDKLAKGRKDRKDAASAEVGFGLTEDDLDKLDGRDWDQIATKAAELRELLPKLKVRKDAAGW